MIDLIVYEGGVGKIYNTSGYDERNNLNIIKTILQALNKPESLITYVKYRPDYDLKYVTDFTKLEW